MKEGKEALCGFGHHIFCGIDPRSRILKAIAYEVFDICGRDPLIDVASELEKRVLTDAYFQQRGMYPNVHFYTGLVWRAMGFPQDFFCGI